MVRARPIQPNVPMSSCLLSGSFAIVTGDSSDQRIALLFGDGIMIVRKDGYDLAVVKPMPRQRRKKADRSAVSRPRTPTEDELFRKIAMHM